MRAGNWWLKMQARHVSAWKSLPDFGYADVLSAKEDEPKAVDGSNISVVAT